MKPTIDNWQTNPLETGPLYPWAGWEAALVVAALLFFLYFLIWKLKSENRHYAQSVRQLTAEPPTQGVSNQHEEHDDG